MLDYKIKVIIPIESSGKASNFRFCPIRLKLAVISAVRLA